MLDLSSPERMRVPKMKAGRHIVGGDAPPIRFPHEVLDEIDHLIFYYQIPWMVKLVNKRIKEICDMKDDTLSHGQLANNHALLMEQIPDMLHNSRPYLWRDEVISIVINEDFVTSYPGEVWTDDLFPTGASDWGVMYWAQTNNWGINDKIIHRLGGADIFSQIIIKAPPVDGHAACITNVMLFAMEYEGPQPEELTLLLETSGGPMGKMRGILVPLVMGIHPMGSEIEGLGKGLAARLDFLRSPFVQTPIDIPHRAARRRQEKTNPGTPIKKTYDIIVMRRSKGEPSDHNTDRHLEHDHRWMVSGHWRNQWYATKKKHMAIWIAPFVQGPEDKPLIVRDKKVFHVVH